MKHLEKLVAIGERLRRESRSGQNASWQTLRHPGRRKRVIHLVADALGADPKAIAMTTELVSPVQVIPRRSPRDGTLVGVSLPLGKLADIQGELDTAKLVELASEPVGTPLKKGRCVLLLDGCSSDGNAEDLDKLIELLDRLDSDREQVRKEAARERYERECRKRRERGEDVQPQKKYKHRDVDDNVLAAVLINKHEASLRALQFQDVPGCPEHAKQVFAHCCWTPGVLWNKRTELNGLSEFLQANSDDWVIGLERSRARSSKDEMWQELHEEVLAYRVEYDPSRFQLEGSACPLIHWVHVRISRIIDRHEWRLRNGPVLVQNIDQGAGQGAGERVSEKRGDEEPMPSLKKLAQMAEDENAFWGSLVKRFRLGSVPEAELAPFLKTLPASEEEALTLMLLGDPKLPPEQREPLPDPVATRELGISVGAFRARKSKAIKKLAKELWKRREGGGR